MTFSIETHRLRCGYPLASVTTLPHTGCVAIEYKVDGKYQTGTLTPDGKCSANGDPHGFDLIPIEPEATIDKWYCDFWHDSLVNTTAPYASRGEAERACGQRTHLRTYYHIKGRPKREWWEAPPEGLPIYEYVVSCAYEKDDTALHHFSTYDKAKASVSLRRSIHHIYAVHPGGKLREVPACEGGLG